jgi:arabinan endo-1,5-alpha-L-arabinosidase
MLVIAPLLRGFTMDTAHPTRQLVPYTNPVYLRDFADIGLLRRPEGYYAYASQGQAPEGMQNIQCAFSRDLVHWQPRPDALPIKAPWAPAQEYWAPDVVELADNDYRMFFNAEVSGSGQGIGVARATHPEGSFTVVGDPLICGEHYRHIDPKVFHNPLDQRWYLLWGSYYEPIVIKELRPDLLGFLDPASAPIALLKPNPHNVTTTLYEAAWMTTRFDPEQQQQYFYLYTSGPDAFGDEGYSVQVARSTREPTEGFMILTEATGAEDSAIYRSNATFVNPGASAITVDASGQEWMLCHATLRADIPEYEQLRQSRETLWQRLRSTRRVMILDPIAYQDGWPYIGDGTPSLSRQNGPVQDAQA